MKTRVLIIAALTAVSGFAGTTAEILWTKPICVETNRYIGWPVFLGVWPRLASEVRGER